VPKAEASAKKAWSNARTANQDRARPLASMLAHGQQFAGDPNGDEKARKAFDESRDVALFLYNPPPVVRAGVCSQAALRDPKAK
jgi:hypothetical protein